MKNFRDTSRQEHVASKLKSALVVASCVLLLTGCATAPGGAETQSARFEFALIGDAPYDGRQEQQFPNVMKEINAADLAFVVHDGDFQWDGAGWNEMAGGMPPCSDATFEDRLRLAQSSRHPFIFTPGDND